MAAFSTQFAPLVAASVIAGASQLLTADNLAAVVEDLQTVYNPLNDLVVKYGQKATPYVLSAGNQAFNVASDAVAFVTNKGYEIAAPHASTAYAQVSSLANRRSQHHMHQQRMHQPMRSRSTSTAY